MMELLLPPGSAAVETFDDVPGEVPYPGEELLIASAVQERRREFVTARRCARQALEQIGYPAMPIWIGPRRQPVWPPGAVGSITHCTGYRAAAVAPAVNISSLGIDAEPNQPLPGNVLMAVTGAQERDMLVRLSQVQPWINWDRLLFSAKESIYKAWHPLAGRFLGFGDACLSVDPIAQTFSARLFVGDEPTDQCSPFTMMSGCYMIGQGLILTATATGPAQHDR